MSYFDFQTVAEQAKIPTVKLEELSKIVRQEFPRDDMMYELHLLRVCMAIRDDHVSLEEAIRTEKAA